MFVMAKTLLIGNFGAENIGDELILNATLDQYPELVVMTNDAEFSQNFTERRFETVDFFPVGFRSWWRFLVSKEYRASISALKTNVDQVVFPGGGLFAIKFRAVFIWFIVFLWVKHLFKDKPVVFERQGIDKGLGWFSKRLVKYVFSCVNKVTVRDKESASALGDLGINDVEVQKDRVLEFLENQTIWKRGEAESKKIVLINALSKIPSDTKDAFLEKFYDYKKVFLAFQKEDQAFLPLELRRDVAFPASKTELFSLFQRSGIVIGERYHFLMLGEFFCGGENTYILKEAYSEKVESFVKEKGIEVWKREEVVQE